MILPARSTVARWLAPSVLLLVAFGVGRMTADDETPEPDQVVPAAAPKVPASAASLRLHVTVPGLLELDGTARAADVDALTALLSTPLGGGHSFPGLDSAAPGVDEVERLLSATLDAYLGPDARALLGELGGRPAVTSRRRPIPPGPGGLRAVPILPEPVRQ